jgi:hypothetical protein
MEQRSLRLGDIVDDYCPRERRLTNHVIVAVIGDQIRQTRCTACEAEHEYREAREPKKKRKSANGESVSGLAGGVLVVPRAAAAPASIESPANPPEAAVDNGESLAPTEGAAAADAVEDPGVGPVPGQEPANDGWLAHRRLIRATLPRVEGAEPQPRPIPEFTMHQRQGRGPGPRGFRPFSGQGGNGNAPFRDGNGPDGNRPSHGGGKGRRRRRRR